MGPRPKDRLAYLHTDWEGKGWPHVPAPAVVLETIHVMRPSNAAPKTWEELLTALGLPEDPPARREAGFRVLAVVRALRVLRLLESEADPLELTDDGFEAIGLPRRHEIEERAAKKAAAWAATAAARMAEMRADRAAREGKYELICGCGHIELADPTPEAITELNARSCPRCNMPWAPSPPSLAITPAIPTFRDLGLVVSHNEPGRIVDIDASFPNRVHVTQEDVVGLDVAVRDAVTTADRAIGDLAALLANDVDESDRKGLHRSEHPIAKAQAELRQMRTVCAASVVGPVAVERRWYCYFCGWNAKVETWKSAIGTRWLCRNCAAGGSAHNEDAPRLLPDDAQRLDEPSYAFGLRIYGTPTTTDDLDNHPVTEAPHVEPLEANSAETAHEVGGNLARLGAEAESSSGTVQLSILGMGGPDGTAAEAPPAAENEEA